MKLRNLYKTRIWRVVSLIAVVLWGCVIFAFSSQDANASGTLSWKVDYKLVDKFNILRSDTDKVMVDDVHGVLDHLVRKSAHVVEYGLFAILILNTLYAFQIPYKRCYGIAMGIVVIYASLDEFHQLFSDGRSAQISDVMIDSFGGVLALGVIAIVVYRYRKKKKRLEPKE